MHIEQKNKFFNFFIFSHRSTRLALQTRMQRARVRRPLAERRIGEKRPRRRHGLVQGKQGFLRMHRTEKRVFQLQSVHEACAEDVARRFSRRC